MVARQTLVVVVSVVVMATFAVVVPAVSAAPSTTLDGPVDETTITQLTAVQTTNDTQAGGDGNDSAFGTQMTAFMQSSAAQAEDSVDNGMWEATFERANESERARLAERRVQKLDDRRAELAEQNRTLSERYRDGSISHDEYVSEASTLNGRVEALEEGVNGTERAATSAGENVSGLAELRTNARNMSGPEVAGVARGLVNGDPGPPDDVPGQGPPGDDGEDPNGPPDDVPGGPNDGTNGNATADPADESGGPQAPGDRGNGTQNPGNRGNGSDGGQGPGAGGPGDGGPGEGAPGNSGGGDGAPGNSGDGDNAPGNSGDEDDAPGNSGDGDGAPGNSGDEDGAPGNSGGDGEPGNSGNGGQGNGDDGPGRGPPGLLFGDILINW